MKPIENERQGRPPTTTTRLHQRQEEIDIEVRVQAEVELRLAALLAKEAKGGRWTAYAQPHYTHGREGGNPTPRAASEDHDEHDWGNEDGDTVKSAGGKTGDREKSEKDIERATKKRL